MISSHDFQHGFTGIFSRGADMTKDSQPTERTHSETPAEGDAADLPFVDRAHSQDPAEGPDTDDEPET
jgi:hypothetical protein